MVGEAIPHIDEIAAVSVMVILTFERKENLCALFRRMNRVFMETRSAGTAYGCHILHMTSVKLIDFDTIIARHLFNHISIRLKFIVTKLRVFSPYPQKYNSLCISKKELIHSNISHLAV